MTTVCPICNPSAQELPRTGDATVHCQTHGDFKVADTVFAQEGAEDYAAKNGKLRWTRPSNERNLTSGL